MIGHAQIFRHIAVILQFQRFALAGKIVELAFALGFEDALLGQPFDETDGSGGLRWPFIAALNGFKPSGGSGGSSRSNRSKRSSRRIQQDFSLALANPHSRVSPPSLLTPYFQFLGRPHIPEHQKEGDVVDQL
jgi:hypothetical protein